MAAIAIDFDDKLWNDAFKEERNDQFGIKVRTCCTGANSLCRSMTRMQQLPFSAQTLV